MTVQNKGHVIMSTDEVVEVSIVSSLFHSGSATSTVSEGHAALVLLQGDRPSTNPAYQFHTLRPSLRPRRL
jgi:hypothetical protein